MLWEQNSMLWEQNSMLWEQNNKLWEQNLKNSRMALISHALYKMSLTFHCKII